MSENGPQSQTQESSFVNEDFDEHEPGEIREYRRTTSSAPRPNQQRRTEPIIPNDTTSIFDDEQAGRRIRLETLVSEYRDGRKSKSVTLEDIESELEREPQLADEEKETTLRLCREEIDATEARVEHGISSGATSSRRRKASERQSIAGTSSSAKSTHLGQSENRSESEIDDDEPKKKRRLKESNMPWFERDIALNPSTNPSCIKTVKSLHLFNRDIKSCKFLVSIAAGSPDNIPLNGKGSSKVNPSISTKSCLLSTGLQLLRNGRHELERQISFLGQLKRRGRFRPPLTGRPRGVAHREQFHLSSLTEPANLMTMPNISRANSPLRLQQDINELSSSILPLETSCAVDNRLYLPTLTSSPPSIRPLSYQTGSNMATEGEDLSNHEESPKSVTDLMQKVVPAPVAGTAMRVKSVEAPTMVNSAVGHPQRIEFYGMRPKYLRYNIWDPDGNLAVTTAEWTHTAKPLPRPPSVQLMQPIVSDTVSKHSHLFKIVSPIKINRFKDLLIDHPNQPLVKSVCDGLMYGFWPWADIWKPDYPETLDLSLSIQSDAEREKFFREQAAIEIAKGQYSESVGSSLLPGMYCMPIYAVRPVPKPHSVKLRLVNDHSASRYSLNSMIDHDHVVGFPMDNLAQFGEHLINLRKKSLDLIGPKSIVVWKSDIEGAYRLCPLHPYWQIKQAVRIGNDFHVDHCIAFGSSASPAIFIAFNSLVTWIAKNKRDIPFITTYVDDSSGCTWADDISYYAPYDKYLPSPQTRLLMLWDDLGIPLQERKQIHGTSIPVIGIQVDPNNMTYTLPDESHAKLLAELELWTNKKGSRHMVRRWQHMAGWMNWCFNVFPLLRPALCNVYDKLQNKTNLAGVEQGAAKPLVQITTTYRVCYIRFTIGTSPITPSYHIRRVSTRLVISHCLICT